MSIGNSIGQSVGNSIGPSIGEGGLVAGSLVHFNETSIVGATPVTQITNIGTGGSGFDLDSPQGTTANLTKTTVNSLDAVVADGSVFIQTTSATNITNPTTEFYVAKINASTVGQGTLMDGRGVNQHTLLESAGDEWGIFQGSVVVFGSTDTALHVWTGEFKGDGATTKLTISGVGSVTGNAGTESFDFGVFFSQSGGGTNIDLTFCEYLLYDRTLNASQIAQNQTFLASKWGV